MEAPPEEGATTSESADSGDACAGELSGEYDLPLHIASIFVIFAVSFLGTIIPLVGRSLLNLFTLTSLPFQCMKLFGAGVILATGFVHMLIPATQYLTDPCLTGVWVAYGGFAGVFALVGALSIQLVQVLASKAMAKRFCSDGTSTSVDPIGDSMQAEKGTMTLDSEARASALLPSSSTSAAKRPHGHHEDDDQHHHHHVHGDHIHSLILAGEKRLTFYLLELGIASHCILVGVALGMATDEFRTLWIALCFHQFFEGLALSSTLIEAQFKSNWAAAVMVVMYSLGTPLGIAIGIVVHLGSAMHATNLIISSGVLDALSAGILIYDVLVNLVQPHLASARFKGGSNLDQALQLGSMWIGTGIMAVIGLWA